MKRFEIYHFFPWRGQTRLAIELHDNGVHVPVNSNLDFDYMFEGIAKNDGHRGCACYEFNQERYVNERSDVFNVTQDYIIQSIITQLNKEDIRNMRYIAPMTIMEIECDGELMGVKESFQMFLCK